MTDPMLSSSSLSVLHDGAVFNRVEKTRLISQHPDALDLLHVCWRHNNERNCGICSKCLRTFATLKLLAATQADQLFDAPLSLKNLSTNYLADDNDDEFMSEVRQLAESVGQVEILAALDHSLNISRRIRNTTTQVRRLPFLWRYAPHLRRILLRQL